jgi:hypothetical protein
MPSSDPKIPKFCMRLDWSVLHNFTNCANFKFPTEIMLKFMEKIQYLNLLVILKESNLLGKIC